MVTPKVTLKGIVVLFLGLVTPVFAQLKWDQPQQAFNAQPGEKAVTAKYRFTNTGPLPVAILDVRPSCGCTSATLAKKEYAPGESGEIDAKFNFAGHVGHQEKWIYVTTNLAGTDPTVLSLAVDIPPEVAIEPEFVMWRIGDPLKPKTMRVVIPDGIPAKMIAVQVDNDSMQVQLQEVQAGKEWRVKVTPTSTSEPVKAVVSIRSDYPATHPVTYTAYARVQ
jgi:Protein of unknown function (DUF1573)